MNNSATVNCKKIYVTQGVFKNVRICLLLTLPEGISAQKIVLAAEKSGVLLTPGTAFFSRQAPDRFIRLSFAVACSEEILQGVKLVGEIIQAELAKIY
ncbi:hypothetical protein [Sporomusa aerivorans]|uniref:hypothetical protein n=1 Tax=Sporomusa aerivorans TaxID=204936 RepID=UPI00352AC603